MLFFFSPGCSVSNSNPSVPENNNPGYVVTTISVEPGFTVIIDPSSPDGNYFTIQGSELQLNRSVDYEVSLQEADCRDQVGNAGMQWVSA